MRNTTRLLLCVAFLGVTHVASAQVSLDADRPSFSISPFTIPVGDWQLETGIEYLRDRDGGDFTSVTIPQGWLRFGLADNFELIFDWEGIRRFSANGQTTTGLTDAAIGLKIQVTDTDAKFAASMFGAISIPIGDDAFTSDSTDPAIGIAWAYAASLDWFGTAIIYKEGSDYTLGNGVGINFAKAARSNAYVEWEASIPDSGSAQHSLNGGYVWRQGRRSQWDINASLGLNDSAPDFGVGGGWAYRF